jgi:very-short-patch-repair endonuclease
VDWRDLARAQAGVISRRQLRECGVTEYAVRGLVGRRELTALLPGIYAPRPVPASSRQRTWAAALWSGGVVSHRSGGQFWELPAPRSTTVHVRVDQRSHPSAPGVRLHRLGQPSQPVTLFDGLPVTSRPDTIVDLLRSESAQVARNLLDRSLQQRWIDLEFLESAVDQGWGMAGNAQLRRLIAQAEPGAEAESERRLHLLLRRARLAGWVAQHPVRLSGGFAYLDVAFPAKRLAIEVDGRRFHDERSDAFERDRARQNELVALGWVVLRFTWRMLVDDPSGVIVEISRILAGIAV